jgi:DNA polymerase III subunit alpha
MTATVAKHPLGVALAVRSDFSIGEATQSVSAALARAAELGYQTVALADTMTVSGLPDLFSAAKKHGVKPIIGVTLRVYDDARYRPPKKGEAGELRPGWKREVRLKAFARTEAGLKGIFRLLSEASSEECFYYNARCDLAMIERHLTEGVALTSGDLQGLFHHPEAARIAARLALHFKDDFAIEYVPIATPLFDTLNARAARSAAETGAQALISYPMLYPQDGADSADVLRAIATNDKMDSPWLSRPFTRDFECAAPGLILDRAVALADREEAVSAAELKRALRNTVAFAGGEFFAFEKKVPSLPQMAADEFAAVVAACKKGWAERFARSVLGHRPQPDDLSTYRERLTFELSVLKKMGFSGYFLLVQEIVSWSKANGIVVGPGRGSVGGSLVAYLMGITDVDPIRFGLLFERFINPDRLDLPDADLDFMSTRRHEVIEHIEATYGADRVAGISNYAALGAASALRDTARVHGLEPFDYACSKQMEKEHGVSLSLEESAARVPDIERFKSRFPQVWTHATALEGAMRGLGRHAAGVVVAGEPVVERAVVETRSGQRVVNWDKRTVEDWGLIKMDILGLSTLDTLKHAADLIRERHGKRIDFLKLALDDARVLRAFAEGDTVGIFQFESAGMRKLLKDLAQGGPLSFEDLVATTALFRPGPIDAGLMDDYVAIKQKRKPAYFEHPNMRASLEPTLGVIIYQEQVMAICRDVAGFTMTEADHVRRAMGKKDKEKMALMREKFIAGATAGFVEVELEDGTVLKVPADKKFPCVDGVERTVEEAIDACVEIASLT